ncbi:MULTISPECIES: VOC family protein [Bacillus]|uniref:VOC family protein n=1 Tax=Bacillus TaxID=1386 RepID=UPI0005E8E558|nr:MULTISPECIES: VOC family protein [Bacillus]COE36111.1 Glyoxalase-like domain [Streptococcus pneumoniae]KAB7634908.1 VOC family protein [Bacillus sp. B3-WWTP-C-10-D-3]MCC0759186.1 VOC family protein [Bacillus sp. BRTN]MCC0771251.1 VOC family protein [Bacillus pacificus]MCU5384706.1 VOC family protein [Bacillus cereus]
MKNLVKFRIARPTNKFEEVIAFYEKGLGLKRIGEFYDHEGYDGVMFGLPYEEYHLEFTRHIDGSPCPAPTKDNLLVFYMSEDSEMKKVSKRLHALGYDEVEPENPYWKDKGITIEDPDGWRIVLVKIEEQGFKL